MMDPLLAIVVNPRDRRRYEVRHYPDTNVITVVGNVEGEMDHVLGHGCLATKDVAADISGYPRAHVDCERYARGRGIGTVIYTGLVVFAHLRHLGLSDDIPEAPLGDGVSSMAAENCCVHCGGRTKSASVWWARANRHGLVRTIHSTFRHNHKADPPICYKTFLLLQSIQVPNLRILPVAPDMEEVSVIEIEQDVEIDIYTYEAAVRAGLILAVLRPRPGVQRFQDATARDFVDAYVHIPHPSSTSGGG